MTTTAAQRIRRVAALDNLLDADENGVQEQLRFIRSVRSDCGGWYGQHPTTRSRVLMQLRHDLEDMLKSVKILESMAEGPK